MYDGALIDGVVRVDYLWAGKVKKGIDGDENDADGVVMDGTPPLKVMVSGYGERGVNVSFPEGRERSIIGLMDKGEISVGNLETPQKSVVPGGEIDIRIGYKRGGEGVGGKGIGISLGRFRHTMDRCLVCQQNQYLVIKVFK